MDHGSKKFSKNLEGKIFLVLTRIGQHLSTINRLLHCLVEEDNQEQEREADGEEWGR